MLPYNNLLFNNTSSFIYDSGYQDLTTISGTITADPQMVNFVLTGGGDYHLKSGSAAINEGTTACASGITNCTPTTDFSGVSRPKAPL